MDESGSATTLSALPHDVLTHILSLLDGPSLAAAGCTSSLLRSLSTHPSLWLRLSLSSFPSSSLLFSSTSSYRSFFADSSSATSSHSPLPPPSYRPPPPHLLSAVDLHTAHSPIFSRLLHTETRSTWFCTSPFRIDALERMDPPLPLTATTPSDLSLSWVVVDPVTRRAANLSSGMPVSMQRHWFSGETQVQFATTAWVGLEPVQFGVVVTCGGCEVREVSFQVEDLEGMSLNGKESLEILQRVMEAERERRTEGGDEVRERYLEFVKMKLERKERKLRRERRLDFACLGFGLSIFALFLSFVYFM